jgi:hypothetical protein
LPERYQSVLEAINIDGWGIGDPVEEGQRCPTACDGLPGGLFFQADVVSEGRAARTTGSYISHDYFQSLVDGFELMHPTEEKSVDISRSLIEAVLNESAEVCGIRFMYGQQAGADLRSRVVLLMACYEKNTGNFVPNLMVGLAGHPLHTGERVSLEACFDLFERHVDRMAVLLPGADRKDLPRGVYFGIDSLRGLMDQPGCAGIRFHFGYNPAKGYSAERYESALEAIDEEGRSIGVHMEAGQYCPTLCDGGLGGGGMLLKAAVNVDLVIGGARSGALYEMYHHLSPAIVDAIVKEGGDHKAIYATAFAESFTLLSEGKADEAAAACRQSLDGLIRKYLTKN